MSVQFKQHLTLKVFTKSVNTAKWPANFSRGKVFTYTVYVNTPRHYIRRHLKVYYFICKTIIIIIIIIIIIKKEKEKRKHDKKREK